MTDPKYCIVLSHNYILPPKTLYKLDNVLYRIGFLHTEIKHESAEQVKDEKKVMHMEALKQNRSAPSSDSYVQKYSQPSIFECHPELQCT